MTTCKSKWIPGTGYRFTASSACCWCKNAGDLLYNHLRPRKYILLQQPSLVHAWRDPNLEYLLLLTTAENGLHGRQWRFPTRNVYKLLIQIRLTIPILNSLASLLQPCTTMSLMRSSLGVFASFDHSKRYGLHVEEANGISH
jgi:hypothetical protein